MTGNFMAREEDQQAVREQEETRERQARRYEAMRKRWLDMLRLPEVSSEFLRKRINEIGTSNGSTSIKSTRSR